MLNMFHIVYYHRLTDRLQIRITRHLAESVCIYIPNIARHSAYAFHHDSICSCLIRSACIKCYQMLFWILHIPFPGPCTMGKTVKTIVTQNIV